MVKSVLVAKGFSNLTFRLRSISFEEIERKPTRNILAKKKSNKQASDISLSHKSN